ncbi:[protein-PII] uridylyltransferase [Rhodoferax sediminis]|uniref:Bifunctional uridylyltransferase/uridylyl-removing enzyme n=1 Tax=Rhodoferax sediminis TaxID=2509614 RepID=A0A515DB94_9BURK|nr:[protein-PII] uridylyltransferase [Rhodoferax sediminis]QDL37666.1 [protein-PII] uridylyltransferase [Rhodoferax sediminis]
MPDLQTLRDDYRLQKAALFQSVRTSGASTRGIHSVLHKLARQADALLQALWQMAAFSEQLALVAVGGYGRGELFPYSDVDVVLLLPDDLNPDDNAPLKRQIEAFIGSCWDTGLEIGSSVRTVSDCVAEAAKDVTVQTSLLESRLVTGSKTLFAEFGRRFDAAMDPAAFFVAKTLELRQRHTKFENTPYALEPNCKESPGGLRDLQVILWVARAAGLGKSWDELARGGLATAFEARQIKRNEALLCLIRARLHLLAHRREDRLVFDLQTAVAESFGYGAPTLGTSVSSLPPEGAVSPGGGPSAKRPAMRSSESLMRRYYWAAKAVTQLNQILLLNIEERLSSSAHELHPINERFFEKAGMIEVASDDLYEKQPHAILETFLLYETTVGVKGLSARTLRALYNVRGVMDGQFRRDPVNRENFKRILQQPEGITHAMRLMNQTSVLGRYLWVFRRIVGQMQHDLFHVYTVDQHILMVLRNVRRFFIAEHAHEYPFCSQLAAGWDKPWILYTAALFHDIAKGRGGDHSELGASEVRRFCRQHDIAGEDIRLIEFLVREHLSMSRIAQKQDLGDPDVIAAFAKRVGNERYLTALYLLTVADIRGTSPKVWNAWKGKLLEDLYRLALRVLGGRAPDPGADVEARKREALVMLALHAEPFEAYKALWDTLDVGYFMRHDAADIAWHARQLSRHVARQAGATAPAMSKAIVRARLSPVGEGLQVLVYTPDKPDLFARICGYFDQASLSILDAKVHTTSNGFALDTFQVVTSFLPEHYRELVRMVEAGVAHAIEQPGELPAPSRGRVSRRVRSFPVTPRVELAPDEKAQRWLLSISASDRVGLLYSVARVLARHKLNLQLAKVTTLGERVEDTFLIDGPELQHNRAQIEIETELLEALNA